MMKFTPLASKKPSLEDIKAFENLIGFDLPKTYKDFIAVHNGGIPENRALVTQDGKISSYIRKFYPLKGDLDDDIFNEYTSFVGGRWLPRNLIPIASDVADNRIVLSVSGQDYGSVYYWSWDEQDEDDPPSYEFTRLIAKDFQEFLDGLS